MTTQAAPQEQEHSSIGKLSFPALLAMTVGSMIAGGIFNLPKNIAESAAPGPALIGWLITGLGMFCLAQVFRALAERRPDLDAGVYAYAEDLFGKYTGFLSGWGYWISAWLGNLAYLALLFGTLSIIYPGFSGEGDGMTWAAIIGASVLLWLIHFLILNGVKTAAFINTIATIGKLLPIGLFVIMAFIGFKADLFNLDFWGTGEDIGGTFEQIKNMMMVTVWVFIGIEGAAVYSARAKKRSDVGKATVIGFVFTLLLMILVNMLSYGAMKRADIAGLSDPSLAGLMEHYMGHAGTLIVSGGLVVSLLGALIAWQLLCAEILQVAGSRETMPEALGRLNGKEAPANAMWLTTATMQVVLILTGLMGGSTYLQLITIASSMVLIPYLFSAMDAAWIFLNDNKEGKKGAMTTAILAIVGVIYSLWLLYAAGIEYLLLSSILYAPGFIVHVINKRQRGDKKITTSEIAITAVLVLLAVVAIVLIATGKIAL